MVSVEEHKRALAEFLKDIEQQMRVIWTKHAEIRRNEWEKKLGVTKQEVEELINAARVKKKLANAFLLLNLS